MAWSNSRVLEAQNIVQTGQVLRISKAKRWVRGSASLAIGNLMKRCKYWLAVGMMGAILAGLRFSGAWAQTEPDQITKSESAPPRASGKLFAFHGGTPREYVSAAANYFQVDWMSIVTIPRDLENVEVPRIRFTAKSASDLLKLYNRLAEQNRVLGKWHLEGDEAKPAVLMLVADSSVNTSKTENVPRFTEVISLGELPESQWKEIENFVNKGWPLVLPPELSQQEREKGRMVIDQRTKCLIVSGSKGFVSFVKAAVMIMENNARVEAGTVGKTKPAGKP
jgi:hypothetical protein